VPVLSIKMPKLAPIARVQNKSSRNFQRKQFGTLRAAP
jgi:hypothetical protein